MYCTSCGKAIDDDSKFCSFCGTTIINNKPEVEEEGVPAFSVSEGDVIPTFSTPTDEVPTFSIPQSSVKESVATDDSVIPTFKVPANDIPTFTAPPELNFNGPACHYHNGEPAVGRCARCGKPLCQDCCDSYGVSAGKYAGQHLCYDCTQKLVDENIQELQQNYATIKGQYTLCIIGCVIGAIIGIIWGGSAGFEGALVYGILCAAIGGSAGTFFKRFVSAIPGFFVSTGNVALSVCIGVFKFVCCFFMYAIMALFETIKKIIYYVSYMKRTSGFIESDTAALQQMKDYMEYTMVRNRDRGVDLETLMQEGSQLYNNSFAQMVREQGEEKAEAYMSQCVTRIAENGEIIREFQNAA